MSRVLQFFRDSFLLIARICLGVVLIAHGWHRWQTGFTAQTQYLAQHGVPYAEVAVWCATGLEVLGGVFLIMGALTPLVAAAVVAEQVLIIVWTKWFRGLSLTGPHGGFEYNVIMACLCLLLVVYGAGRASVDRLFRRPKDKTDSFDSTL